MKKIGQGLPLLMPKGAKIVQLLQRWVEKNRRRKKKRIFIN